MIGLYAIAEGAPASCRGAQGEALRIVRCGGLELVIGDAAPPLSADALRAYEAAVRAIADASAACLPARFNSTAVDDEALLRIVRARNAELDEALARVRGREQMTLRVHGTAATPQSSSGGPGTRYLEDRRRARAIPELDPLRAALVDLVRAERVERHDSGGLIASVYHLIDRGAAPLYREVVDVTALGELRAAVSGPWPAWAFAPGLEP